MLVDIKANKLTISETEYELDEILAKLVKLSIEQFNDFFANRERKASREINMLAMRAAVNDKVEHAKELGLSDEQLYRLTCYPTFCETQLQNFVKIVTNESVMENYLKALWKLFLVNDEALALVDAEIEYLLQLPKDDMPNDFALFADSTVFSFADQPGNFDGLPKDDFRDVCNRSSTLNELREIGAKYGLNIPRRLKKEELQAIIVEELIAMGKYDEETAQSLDIMSVLTMQRFAKKNDIKISIELKKEELIEYVIRQADKTGLPTIPRGIEISTLPELSNWEFKCDMVEEVVQEAAAPIADIDNGFDVPTFSVDQDFEAVSEKQAEPESQPSYSDVLEDSSETMSLNDESNIEPISSNDEISIEQTHEEPITPEFEEIPSFSSYKEDIPVEPEKEIKQKPTPQPKSQVKDMDRSQQSSQGITAEEVRKIVRESVSNNQIQQQGISGDDLRYLVEGTVRQIVTQIVDKIPGSSSVPTVFAEPTEDKGDFGNNMQRNTYHDFEVSSVISNSTNRLFDSNLAASMNRNTGKIKRSEIIAPGAEVNEGAEAEVAVAKPSKKELKAIDKARAKAKIERHNAAIAKRKRQTNIKGLLRESGRLSPEDLKFVQDQTAILEYQSAKARVKAMKSSRRKRNFIVIFVILLLAILTAFALAITSIMNPSFMPSFSSWLQSSMGPLYDQLASFANWLKGLFG